MPCDQAGCAWASAHVYNKMENGYPGQCKPRHLRTGIQAAQVVQCIKASIAVLLYPCVRGLVAAKRGDAIPWSCSSLRHMMRCCWHADASKTCAPPAVRPTDFYGKYRFRYGLSVRYPCLCRGPVLQTLPCTMSESPHLLYKAEMSFS